MNENYSCNGCLKTKHRDSKEKKDIIIRLNKIEGQIRGVKQMINDDRYCDDILIQMVAIKKSIKSLGNNILKNHMHTCVVDEINKGNNDIIDEVMKLIGRFN
ncbi:MAG TPA: metal-sensing transcriptional repressor [Tenericutes bacterium]|nr:metal-sensing transcriptional repressor [Mycoplasmatota bacterium]